MIKEFWVRLYSHEKDDYNELWKTKKNQYFARHTYGSKKIWCMVCDPLGYCELDCPCHNDYIFHVCDSKYNELFISTNADDSCNFPTLNKLIQTEWSNFKSRENGIRNCSELYSWLLSFKIPELYGKEAEDYDDNWKFFYIEKMKNKNVAEFQYLGKTYYITADYMKHKICGAEWINYCIAGQLMGSSFDE